MCVKEWKRIAEWEAMHYRERKAFLRGVRDADGSMTARAEQYRRWVVAIDGVLLHLKRYEPEKERFFRLYCGIDGGGKQHRRNGMVALTFVFHVSESTLYQWKNDVLSLLLIAAAETGALKPFRSGKDE